MNQAVVRENRKVRKGIVVSNKMDKTVVVKVTWTTSHPKYSKVITKSLKCYAHNDLDMINEGDEVLIMETRPLSKTKRWRVVEKCVRG
jgi:small subunit ribosomal protein S17